MIKRCWIVTITSIALLIFIGLGQSQEQTKSPNRQAERQQKQSQTFPVPLPVKFNGAVKTEAPVDINIIESVEEADTRQRRAKESEQREIKDLIAQQGMNASTQAMNKATQDMRDYTFYSTLFVAVGTALLFVTLGFAWQANKAALEAIQVTREIGIAETQSYISVIGGGYILNHGGFSGWADVINTGNSPAINPFLKFDIRLENAWFGQAIMGSSPEPFDLIESMGRKSKIQPNETSRFYFYWSADEFGDRFKSLDNERTTIVISCKVESKTIYKGITDKGEWDLTNHPGFVRVSDRSKISEGVLYTRQRQRR